ncbi:MAG: DNA cytosine methyltransferase [Phascolarctobacterium sp.]
MVASEIPDFDVMLAGFPCRAFSIAGLRKVLMMKDVVHCFELSVFSN